MRIAGTIPIFIMLAAFNSHADAGDLRVSSAVASDGKIECNAQTNYSITTISGPCEAYTPPEKIALGQRFAANGKEHQIGVIVASKVEKDMLDYGIDIRKGDWICLAAENLENIPSDKNQDENLIWLFIRKCQPNDAIPTTMDR